VSREILPELPDESIHAVVTDPPYGTTEADKAKVTKRGSEIVEFGQEWDRELPLWWITEIFRILKPGGSVIAFVDTKRVDALWSAFETNGLRPLQCIYWRKTNPPPNPRKNFCSAVESAVFGRKEGKILWWAGGGVTHNIYDHPIVSAGERQHPTQKPERLMSWLIQLITPTKGTVLDPFMGSGTSALGCAPMGCNFLGIEKEPEYFEIAKARIAHARRQGRLF